MHTVSLCVCRLENYRKSISQLANIIRTLRSKCTKYAHSSSV
jgi:hypothetical protein